MATVLDPYLTRLSDSLMLSDLLGCDSVYRHGIPNNLKDNEQDKLSEGMFLAELMDSLQDDYGPYSVCYGYISPRLSSRVVKYQDPDKPSYHRWDDGAALDACFHEWVQKEKHRGAPIYLAHLIDEDYDYSRMITYSESPWICLATKITEGDSGRPRKAFYENRYTGVSKEKPKFIQKSKVLMKRAEDGKKIVLPHGWKGQGWPSYHGGGREQYEHIRINTYMMLSDLLYDRNKVARGIPNPPPEDGSDDAWHLKAAADVVGNIVDAIGSRVSIVQGYCPDTWSDGFKISVIPPVSISADDLVDILYEDDLVDTVGVIRKGKGFDRVKIYGVKDV